MGNSTRPLGGIAESGATATIGGLAGTFVIVAVECQRHWPEPVSLIYLAISGGLLLLWCAYLATWPMALRHARTAISGAIVALVVASLVLRLSASREVADELAGTLLFWAPLVAAWWGYVYADQPERLAGLVGSFLVIIILQIADTIQDIPAHLILSILVAGIVRITALANRAGEATVKLRDSLTGLASAECFEAELAHASAIADRYQISLALIGLRIRPLDEDKGYSEELRRYADAIANCLRNADTACRWDETTVVILLPNTTEKQATVVFAKIDKALQQIAVVTAKPSLLLGQACVEHQAGEDPMSTLSTLETRLAEITR